MDQIHLATFERNLRQQRWLDIIAMLNAMAAAGVTGAGVVRAQILGEEYGCG